MKAFLSLLLLGLASARPLDCNVSENQATPAQNQVAPVQKDAPPVTTTPTAPQGQGAPVQHYRGRHHHWWGFTTTYIPAPAPTAQPSGNSPPPQPPAQESPAPQPPAQESPAPQSPAAVSPYPASSTSPPASSSTPTSGGAGNLTPDQQGALDAHNQARAEVHHNPLVWDADLAAHATAKAQRMAQANPGNLNNGHEGYGGTEGMGENLMMGWVQNHDDLTTATNDFLGEKNNYHGEKIGDGNFGSYGHYTQIIWASTTKVGMGMAVAADGQHVYVVARYMAPGNYIGQAALP